MACLPTVRTPDLDVCGLHAAEIRRLRGSVGTDEDVAELHRLIGVNVAQFLRKRAAGSGWVVRWRWRRSRATASRFGRSAISAADDKSRSAAGRVSACHKLVLLRRGAAAVG
jgi:hypothetical protein